MYYEDEVLHKKRLEASMPHPINLQMDISKDQLIDPPSFNSPIEVTPLKATKAFIEDDSNRSIIKVIKENNIMERYLTQIESNEELEGMPTQLQKNKKEFQEINTLVYQTIWLNFSYIFLLVCTFWLPYTVYFHEDSQEVILILIALFNFFDQIIFITRQKQQNRIIIINQKNILNSNTLQIILVIITLIYMDIAIETSIIISILQLHKLNKVTTIILIRIKFPILKYKSLIMVFVTYVWLIHAQACIFWELIQDQQSVEYPYTYCFYVSVTIITGQFEQDIHNQYSMIFVSIMMIISVLINYHLLFTGYLSFQETSKSSVALWNQLENMKLKLQKTNLPILNQFIILNQLKKLKSDRDFEDQIQKIYHYSILQKIQSLKSNFSSQTIRQLSTKIQELQGERGDKFNKNGLYIIENGILKLNYESEYSKHRLKELKDGQYFGEVELFTNQSQSLSLECQTKSKVLYLSSEDFFQIMSQSIEKDSLQFGQNPQLILSQCYICKENHLLQNCCLIRYVPDMKMLTASENQLRQVHFRKYHQNRRRHKALKKVKDYNKHNLQSSICSDYVEDDESDYSSYDEESVQSQQMKNKSFNLLGTNTGNMVGATNTISNEIIQGDMQSEKFSMDFTNQYVSNPHVFSKKQIGITVLIQNHLQVGKRARNSKNQLLLMILISFIAINIFSQIIILNN